MTTYKLARKGNDYFLIAVDAHGIEHPQETVILQQPISREGDGTDYPAESQP